MEAGSHWFGAPEAALIENPLDRHFHLRRKEGLTCDKL